MNSSNQNHTTLISPGNTNFQPEPEVPAYPQQNQPSKKSIVFPIAVLVICAACAGFYWLGTQQASKSTQEPVAEIPVATPTVIVTPVVSASPVAISPLPANTPYAVPNDWKVFNNVNGYQLRLPTDSAIFVDGYGVGIKPENSEGIRVMLDKYSAITAEKNVGMGPNITVTYVGDNLSAEELAAMYLAKNLDHPNSDHTVVQVISPIKIAGKNAFTFTIHGKMIVDPGAEYMTREGDYVFIFVPVGDRNIVLNYYKDPTFELIANSLTLTK